MTDIRDPGAVMQRGEIIDDLFGEISWQLEPDRLQLHGDGIPDAELSRSGSDAPVPWIPIGTRRRELLTMTVAGHPVELRPGKGRMSRRSYRIEVLTTGGPLLFTPSSPTEARLVRGTSYRGDNELGVFERTVDGSAHCTWSNAVSALGVTVEAPAPRAEEAALGYALALGFGTGAQMFLPALMSALGRMIPG